jgi:hypothetical protein
LGPKVGTGMSSGHRLALRIARWWHRQQETSSERTPFVRMLPRVKGFAQRQHDTAALRATKQVDRFHRWSRRTWTGGAGRAVPEAVVILPRLRGPEPFRAGPG